MNAIKHLIEQLRKEPVEDLAEEIGVHPQQLRDWRDGKKNPSNTTISKICDKLNLGFRIEHGQQRFFEYPYEWEILVWKKGFRLVVESTEFNNKATLLSHLSDITKLVEGGEVVFESLNSLILKVGEDGIS